MRRDKKVLLAAMLGAAVMAAPAVSMAQARGETGWYAGITLGQSDFKNVDCSGFSCDKKDTAFRILGGYQINRNFAAELGYHDLGKMTASAPPPKSLSSSLVDLQLLNLPSQLQDEELTRRLVEDHAHRRDERAGNLSHGGVE